MTEIHEQTSSSVECAALSQTLDIIGRRDIGCVLEGSSASPNLTRGITSANFQTRANVFEEKEILTKFVIAESVVGKLSFSTLAVTLSRPGALFDGKDLIIFPTSSSVTD